MCISSLPLIVSEWWWGGADPGRLPVAWASSIFFLAAVDAAVAAVRVRALVYACVCTEMLERSFLMTSLTAEKQKKERRGCRLLSDRHMGLMRLNCTQRTLFNISHYLTSLKSLLLNSDYVISGCSNLERRDCIQSKAASQPARQTQTDRDHCIHLMWVEQLLQSWIRTFVKKIVQQKKKSFISINSHLFMNLSY